jgi:predicted nucleic acid-binding Zn ribbon protein
VTREDPVPLRDALAAVGKELGLPATNDLDELIAVWSDLVGSDVAEHARVRGVRDGECTIEVDGPAWATRVRYLMGDLQRHANERCGESFLTSVRVVVAAPRRTV